MPSFDDAIAAGLSAIRTAVGVALTYRRAGVGTCSIEHAAVGQSQYALVDAGGNIRQRVDARDFLVGVADLVIDEESIEPRAGDTIEQETAAGTRIYQVAAPDDSGDVWRYSDAGETQYRIHARRIT